MKLVQALYLICFCFPVFSQNVLDLDHIWVKGTFTPKEINSIQWYKNTDYFAGLKGNKIMRFSVTRGSQPEILLDGNEVNLQIAEFSISSDEENVLILANKTKIWRRSYQGDYFIFNTETRSLEQLNGSGDLSYATFSPDGKKVAYVKSYDLFIWDLEEGKEKRITDNGEENMVLNGFADWTYEEEFYLTKAFCWSPKSDKLAFLSFDQTQVPIYPLQVWEGLYTHSRELRYSKAGEKISDVDLMIYHLNDGKTIDVNLGPNDDVYVPAIQWTYNNDLLSAIRINRFQNKLEILHIGANSGMAQIILIDAARAFVDFNYLNELTYLADGESFIYPSEKTGYKHFFQFEMSGKIIRQITSGDWDADKLVLADSKSGNLYFTSTEEGPAERHFYEISLKGKKKRKLSEAKGWHKIQMSPDAKYFLDHHSNLSTPPSYKAYSTSNAKLLAEFEDNAELEEKRKSFGLVIPELTSFEGVDSTILQSYSITPKNIEPGKKYPALIYVYGGPGSQKVKNKWQFTERELWHQSLVQKGYFIFCVDNRGTAGKGVQFKKQVYRNLGKMESEDQILVAKSLQKKPEIDPERIGIWGWSYGGYMSSLCKFLEPELFRSAVAVAPVTHWGYYNAAYTERYMQQPSANQTGYAAFSPLNLSHGLKGDYMLIHAAEDDNVHLQNSMELAQKLVQEDKQFDFFVYPKGDHKINVGISRKNVYQKIADFILRTL